MLCKECVYWTAEVFTYDGLHAKWDSLLGTAITPGYEEKFLKESKRLSLEFSETQLSFKYCAKGCIDRFYIMRTPLDMKPKKVIHSCSYFSTSDEPTTDFPIPGPLWSYCATEAHGPTVYRGQTFVPGLYEHTQYFSLPTHNRTLPEIGVAGQCSICGSDFERGIVVREITFFCCNKHYLQWWKGHHPKTFEKLNKVK
jgi:hypothetical protein